MLQKQSWGEAFPEHEAICNLVAQMTLQGTITIQQQNEWSRKNEQLMHEEGMVDINLEGRVEREKMRKIAKLLKQTLADMITDPDAKTWVEKAYIDHLKQIDPSAVGRDLN